MLRSALLYLSNQRQVFDFVRHNGLAKQLASRFVAGEEVEPALDAVRALNGKGITASLDLLGESVTNAAEARATGREYVHLLDRIEERGLDANVSVKLTALGLDIGEDLCLNVVHTVLDRARELRTFVRLDMESSAYTERTLQLFYDRLYPEYPENVGIVLQSYLYRTEQDAVDAARAEARVRICKGAYKEPPTIAFPEKADVDRSYVRAMHTLMRDGHYPAIATHDEAILDEAKRFARAEGIATDRFEFQMLYGVRRDLQEQLVRQGYRLRVYVPFGTSWYPYLMRRLAERPANLMFMTGNVLKEALSGVGRENGPDAAAPAGRASGNGSATASNGHRTSANGNGSTGAQGTQGASVNGARSAEAPGAEAFATDGLHGAGATGEGARRDAGADVAGPGASRR